MLFTETEDKVKSKKDVGKISPNSYKWLHMYVRIYAHTFIDIYIYIHAYINYISGSWLTCGGKFLFQLIEIYNRISLMPVRL